VPVLPGAGDPEVEQDRAPMDYSDVSRLDVEMQKATRMDVIESGGEMDSGSESVRQLETPADLICHEVTQCGPFEEFHQDARFFGDAI